MKCAKCNYEFCWLCKDSYFGYVHKDQDAHAGVTFAKNATAVMLAVMAVVSVIYKGNLHPQKILISLVLNVVAFVIGIVYLIVFFVFYGKQKLT